MKRIINCKSWGMIPTFGSCDRLSRAMYQAFMPPSHEASIYKKATGRDHCPALSITDDMPESGGGGGGTDGVEVAASDDDDDGGDDDGEPARRSPHAKPHPTFPPALLAFTPLSHYVTFGRSRIYQLIADPVLRFPSPIKIGKSSRWLKTEVDSWLAKQADSRHQVAR